MRDALFRRPSVSPYTHTTHPYSNFQYLQGPLSSLRTMYYRWYLTLSDEERNGHECSPYHTRNTTRGLNRANPSPRDLTHFWFPSVARPPLLFIRPRHLKTTDDAVVRSLIFIQFQVIQKSRGTSVLDPLSRFGHACHTRSWIKCKLRPSCREPRARGGRHFLSSSSLSLSPQIRSVYCTLALCLITGLEYVGYTDSPL